MITASEIAEWAARLGVAEQQVRHDHLVSHLIVGLEGIDRVVFFGGTALSRTYLEGRRLSEDIDLYLDPRQPPDQGAVVEQLQEGSQREFPGLSIESARRQSDVTTYVATHADLSISVQIVGARPEHRAYEIDEAAVSLRYSDLQPSVALLVPNVATFGAMKLGAYEDRRAARDLFDLAELVIISGLTSKSLAILKQVRGVGPIKHRYADHLRPTNSEWQTQLGHQTKALGDPKEALEVVRTKLVEIGAW